MWTPEAIAKLQHATRQSSFDTYKEYATIINDQSKRHMTFRGLFEFKFGRRTPVPLEEVEPAREIVKRFATGATSRLDFDRGAYHARDRHEPHRRQVQHRRGRRGSEPLRAGEIR